MVGLVVRRMNRIENKKKICILEKDGIIYYESLKPKLVLFLYDQRS